ncbi:NAD(P)-binding protein [Polychaeton citri CBS 116435]|uniref:NAD(P)-binding protein n=1 Tax=Polychaeton citri CBS 116435 TaxID=1314669 RepID=A0A9P4QGC9_9PEZI|nr:NAD(P)-binding protein [Polychaeton citri CBS 116435]
MGDQTKYTSKLHGKHILVIGGSGGIGYGVAEAALEHGATVTISSSNPTRIENSVTSLGAAYPSAKGSNRIHGEACDIGDASTAEANLATLLDKVTSGGTSKLAHIVWTAGSALDIKPLSALDATTLTQTGTSRFLSPLLLAKLAPPYMLPGPESSITLTSGTVSERPLPGWAVMNSYATGLQGMVRGLALDLAPLRFNLVCPGAVDTTLWAGMPEEAKKAMFTAIEGTLPTGRVGQVVDVAESYLYFIKDRNATGSMVSTNGGALLKGP